MLRRARARGRRLLAAFVIAAVIGGCTEAWAAFDSVSTAAQSVSTAVLEPPSGTSATTTKCSVLLGSTTTVTWTATPSTWADGYEVLTSSLPGGPYSVARTVSGASTTTAEISSLALGTTIYIVVRASRDEWRSAGTPEVKHTAPLVCL